MKYPFEFLVECTDESTDVVHIMAENENEARRIYFKFVEKYRLPFAHVLSIDALNEWPRLDLREKEDSATRTKG